MKYTHYIQVLLTDHVRTPECSAQLARYSPWFNIEFTISLFGQPVEIKCGSYGLGAFACQNMHPGTFLGGKYHLYYVMHFDSDVLIAYVGHILSVDLADPLKCVLIWCLLIEFLMFSLSQ